MMSEAQFREDFLEYSGGFDPTEAHDEMMAYLATESCAEGTKTRAAIKYFFERWIAEIEANKEES